MEKVGQVTGRRKEKKHVMITYSRQFFELSHLSTHLIPPSFYVGVIFLIEYLRRLIPGQIS